ncbi:CapA family protein [Abyssisolibacter fermentans]|uniref:CapA family protein n=1 Tax=Abyssisolibacter fermentans TaxID=1766203 RepID=UPI000836B504|nr:CapA family protein [Abyssisolibacter fermentans]
MNSRYRRKRKNQNRLKRILFFVVLLLLMTFSVGAVFRSLTRTTSATDDKLPANGDNIVKEENNNEDNSNEENIEDNVVQASLLAAGDIMFHSTQLKAGYDKQTKSYNFDSFFKSIKPYVQEADLAICNFESVTAGDKYRFTGFPTFNTPDSAIGSIKNAGFDVLTTANNHCLDKRESGLFRTIDVIKEYNLKSTGTYKDDNHEILIQDVNGIKMAILSYTYGCNGFENNMEKAKLEKMVNIIDEEKIKDEIKKAEDAGVDLVIMCMHWGYEYNRHPSDIQKNLAKKMIEWGADIILGSHPHVVQDAEIVKHNGEDKFIIYSMGNLISNQRRETMGGIKNKEYTEDGLMIRLNLEKDIKANKTIIKAIEYIPTWVNRYKTDGKFHYDVIPTLEYIESDDTSFSSEVLARIKQSYEHTMELMQ